MPTFLFLLQQPSSRISQYNVANLIPTACPTRQPGFLILRIKISRSFLLIFLLPIRNQPTYRPKSSLRILQKQYTYALEASLRIPQKQHTCAPGNSLYIAWRLAYTGAHMIAPGPESGLELLDSRCPTWPLI